MKKKRELTNFTKKVYSVVLSIPFGEVRSYKWVAKRIGMPSASRAVGQVLRRNPYPLLIPCHRVVCSDGNIGGYIWGKKIKKALIDLERQIKDLMI